MSEELKAFKVVYVAGNRLESAWMRDEPWRITYQPGRWSESLTPVTVVKTREEAEAYMNWLWRTTGFPVEECELWEVEVDEFVDLPYGQKLLRLDQVEEYGERFWAGEMPATWPLGWVMVPPGGTIGAASVKLVQKIPWSPPRPG